MNITPYPKNPKKHPDSHSKFSNEELSAETLFLKPVKPNTLL